MEQEGNEASCPCSQNNVLKAGRLVHGGQHGSVELGVGRLSSHLEAPALQHLSNQNRSAFV